MRPVVISDGVRLGDLVLDLDLPDAEPTTRLDLEPCALFPAGLAA